MLTYEIQGPFDVPTYQGKAAKIVDSEKLPDFWKSCDTIATRKGCYVFAVRAGKGFRPVYIGKATKTFQQEVFSPHKLEKYQRCLADFKKGTPVLFFVLSPSVKGKPNISAIEQLEDFLIQTGVARNPELLNIRGTKEAEWAIAGVLRSGVGKPSKASREFKRVMGL